MIGKILKGIGIAGIVYTGMVAIGCMYTKYLEEHGLYESSFDQEAKQYEDSDYYRKEEEE